MEWLLEIAQILLLTGLAIWVLVLRRELKALFREQQLAARAVKKSESLSAQELQALQESLAALVQEVETFVEDHREEMGEGLEQVRGALQKIETVRKSAPKKAVPASTVGPGEPSMAACCVSPPAATPSNIHKRRISTASTPRDMASTQSPENCGSAKAKWNWS